MSDIGDQVLKSNSRTLAPEAVGFQVALMSLISAVTILAFNVLRPNNKIIYEPKVKYHVGDKPPPRISDSIFGWLPPLIFTKEPELVDKVGLDAVTFLRFLRLMRWLFTGIAVMTCGILIPINVIYNLKNVDKEKRDVLTMLTIRDVGGNLLFAHVAVVYLITIFACGMMYLNWKHMVRLRHQWFRSPEYLQSFYARTLAVMHVPKEYQSDQGLKNIFGSTKVPYPTTGVHIGRKVGKLPELIEYHNNTVRNLERVLVRYLKGGKMGRKRPTIKIGATLGLGGQTKDAIDFYTAKLKRTEAAIEEYRNQIDTRKAENYGFASMAAVPYAHVVAHQLQSKHPMGTDITLAPNPKDIIWSNMSKSDAEIRTKEIHGFLWLALVCFINTVPLLFISFLANLDSLTAYVHFLDKWKTASKSTFSLVSGVLPPAVSGIFGFFLPIMMRWLTRYMGALTHSRLDRAVVARYFFFLVISQLIIFTLIGVIFQSAKVVVQEIGNTSFQQIIKNLHKLPSQINRTYIDQSSYWLTFFPLRGFLAVFDLAQIVNLLWLSFKTRMFGRTPRDIREWTQPPEFQYAVYYSNILFMGTVGIVFAPLAPLVALAAAIVFWISSFVYKYQMMFVYVTKVETGGRLWNVVMNRLLASIILMQLLMILTIGLQYGWRSFEWLSTVPPLLIIIGFKIYTNSTFDAQFRYFTPAQDELTNARIHSERSDVKGNRLEKRFGHPALNADLFTPMLHAKMMPLLSQVYSGKIDKSHAKLDEYGGQRMDAQVVEGGIRIAAISQSDLEYDPALYRRDRGELDWDNRSINSTNYLNEGASKFAGSTTTLLPGYDRYLAGGPTSAGQESFELSPMDSPREPLLSPTSMYFQQQHQHSHQGSLAAPHHQHAQRPSELSYSGVPMERGASPAPSAFYFDGRASPYPDYNSPVGPQSANPLLGDHRASTPLSSSQYPPRQPQQQQPRPYSPMQQGPPRAQFAQQQPRPYSPVQQGSQQPPPFAQQHRPYSPSQSQGPPPPFAQPERPYSPSHQQQYSSNQPVPPGAQYGHSQSASMYSQHTQQGSSGSGANMAGRGAHRT